MKKQKNKTKKNKSGLAKISQLCSCSAKWIFFIVKAFKYIFGGGSVGRWLLVRWVGGSVGKWSMVSWSLVGGSVVDRFNKTLKLKARITGRNPAAGNTKDVEIAAPLKCLSNFKRTLEMHLINYEKSLQLTWPAKGVITSSNSIESRLYKITRPIKIKRTINWNKYQ